MFRAHVLIVRRVKIVLYSLWYRNTYKWPSGAQSVHRTATYRWDDTRDCIVQFCPPDDDHMFSKHVEAWNKRIIKFSASSWLILRNKYIEMHGRRNVKKKVLHFVRNVPTFRDNVPCTCSGCYENTVVYFAKEWVRSCQTSLNFCKLHGVKTRKRYTWRFIDAGI